MYTADKRVGFVSLYTRMGDGGVFMTQPSGEQSLRERVRGQVLELIGKMDLSYSTRLLSEGQLAEKFQVSRSTVRAVLRDLEIEGKVNRRQGSGTYVNARAMQVNTTLYPRIDLRNIIERNGYKSRNEILSVRLIPAGSLGVKLNCSPTHQLQEVRSLYYADQKPCMYCIDCIRNGRVKAQNWRDMTGDKRSLYEFLRESSGIHVMWDMMRLRAATSGEVPDLTAFFEVPPGKVKAFTLLEITNYDEENNPVLQGTIYVDTEMIRLNLIRDVSQL